jgi:hypothetical protein
MNTTKNLLVAGSRGYGNYKELSREISAYCEGVTNVTIITGCARGVDYMAGMYARERGLQLKVFLADWKTFGKSAGPIRNRQMARNADAAILFWDGKSKGTKNMIEELRKKGVTSVKVIRVIT